MTELEKLNAECERAWAAYRIAHNQAMSNGEAAANARAEVEALSERVGELEGNLTECATALHAFICLIDLDGLGQEFWTRAPEHEEAQHAMAANNEARASLTQGGE